MTNIFGVCTVMSDLPDAPGDLQYDGVRLVFEHSVEGVPHLGYVPYYHFHIVDNLGVVLGHINFRVGDTEHVQMVAGHIGYAIHAEHRGNGYAAKACIALRPWARMFYSQVWLTADPGNAASIKTILKLGARHVDTVDVPPHEIQYQQGSKRKCRYLWVL